MTTTYRHYPQEEICIYNYQYLFQLKQLRNEMKNGKRQVDSLQISMEKTYYC